MSHLPEIWPLIRTWVVGGGTLGLTGTIVTFRPCAANRPLSWAMYRPAESMAGKALTTMFVFSSLSGAVPLPDPPEEHPAASIVTATAGAMSMVRGFILCSIRDCGSGGYATGWLGAAIGGSGYCVTMIIRFRTVRHMPNDTTCPNLTSFC